MPASNRCGRRKVLGAVERDRGDHGAAGEEGRQRVQQLSAPVQRADAGGSEHLVAGEHGEVDIERVEVEGQVRRGLAGVEHDEGADRVRQLDERRDGVDRAEHVGHVGERDHLGARADDLGRLIEPQLTVVVEADDPEGGTGARGELLPGNEVGVVLRLGDDDLVAGPSRKRLGGGSPASERCVRHPVGEEVDAFGGVGGPDELVGRGADEAGDGARASSNSSVASPATVWAPRCTADGVALGEARSASSTWRGFCEVAPESR